MWVSVPILNMGQFFKSGLLCLAILCILSIGRGAENPPTESECRPHIEKALNKLNAEGVEIVDSDQIVNVSDQDDSNEENSPDDAVVTDAESNEDNDGPGDGSVAADGDQSDENDDNNDENSKENSAEDQNSKEEDTVEQVANDDDDDSKENDNTKEESSEANEETDKQEDNNDSKEDNDTKESEEGRDASAETENANAVDNDDQDSKENSVEEEGKAKESVEDDNDDNSQEAAKDDDDDSKEDNKNNDDNDNDSDGDAVSAEKSADDDDDDDSKEQNAKQDNDSKEDSKEDSKQDSKEDDNDKDDTDDDDDDDNDSKEGKHVADGDDSDENNDDGDDDNDSKEQPVQKRTVRATKAEPDSIPEDDLLIEYEEPTELRDRSHIDEILHLDSSSVEKEEAIDKAAETTLKELKRIYENAIKPLETLYKYRDLSNRHFGDPEIFSKPLVLLMGPYSGGKSSIVNYLTDNEYTDNSLRTGAEPSPAYFNILMHGEKPEVLDGTQMSADWTFSGLQKFGQGLQDRLRGHKLPSKLLEKVNIVEIPGILEVRKQVSQLFPFNDACQWFIDRADIILLVYDPAKLDAGPETEAILDQLKGREYQTRILLNKGDQIKAEELLRVQGALIWNISPLMSSAQPPVMYTVSLWSHPFEDGAPIRLLQAHERALLQDLRIAINQRIDNKIASARRFAVRVRNHAKMVDCYLTTYYNHKGLFSNKKKVSGDIIDNPQNYHIYEGLATLTNISRYDLPDPNAYREFFRLNPLYEFKKLSETCTYFRGCPINKLDVAIAYDLPELVGKNKKAVELALSNLEKGNTGTTNNNNNNHAT